MGEYLALPDGSGRFPQNFTYFVVLGNIFQRVILFSLTGLSPSMVELSRTFS
jgi:hypothetical protein